MAIVVVVWYATSRRGDEQVNTEKVAMCYFYGKDNPNGVEDREWLRLDIDGNNATGEYQHLPAERDSKVGVFQGTVGEFDPYIAGRRADVWWDSMAEGMQVTEQLLLEFGEGSAVALFGEMMDRGDGTYVYRDASTATPGFPMAQVDCDTLAERLAVESYVREYIGDLAEDPVLGGTWYVTDLSIDTTNDAGDVEYEDGHIQKQNHFSYIYSDEGVEITNFNFGK